MRCVATSLKLKYDMAVLSLTFLSLNGTGRSPRRSVRVSPSLWRGSVTAIVGASALVLTHSPALAATPFPTAPNITAVTVGAAGGELTLVYSAPVFDGGSPITAYDVSLDGGKTWYTCSGQAGLCPLGNLANGRTYSLVLRAVNAIGKGEVSNIAVGIPSVSSGGNPDKPVVLPNPRARVTAWFTGAGNNLGVSGVGSRLGVGTLPKLTFSRDIPSKVAVERHLAVTATNASGEVVGVSGAWGWLNNHSAVFRPKNWWPGNSTITIISTLNDVVLGKSGRTYLVGSQALGRNYTFMTGNGVVIKVDGSTDKKNDYVSCVRRKTFNVYLGKSGWATMSGVMVISTNKLPMHTYTSEALNITDPNDQYILKNVPWNTRLTPTGEFMHAAPWAYGRLGKWNGSHGCTNMYADDAKWIFDTTSPGDVVVYTNTGGPTVQYWNGPGGLWNIPWSTWLSKSALHNANN